MNAFIWLIGAFFGSALVFMIHELRQAPEAVEDETGFRVIRAAPVSARAASCPAHRPLGSHARA